MGYTNRMADKQMDQFDLSKLPPQSTPALPESVRDQVRAMKASEARLGNAMEAIEPENAGGNFKATVFEAPNLKVNAIGKVLGANVRAKF